MAAKKRAPRKKRAPKVATVTHLPTGAPVVGTRETKLTPGVQAKIVKELRAGNYRKHAAARAGVTVQTIARWMKYGSGHLIAAKLPDDRRRLYESFAEAVTDAEAEAVCENVRVITTAAADGDWRAAKAFLACKAPAQWGDGGKAGAKEQFEALLQVIEDVLGKESSDRVLSEYVARSDQATA